MAGIERVGNLGYLGIAPQVDKNTPAPATDFVPLYDDTTTTSRNLIDQNPIFGNKFQTFNTVPGQRQHGGDVTVLAEANTALKFFDSLLTVGAKSGAGPYTWPLSLTPNGETYYTYDISTGNVVKRFWGVKASKITPDFNDNEMRLKISISALGSFTGNEIESISGTGPYTITFKTNYDPAPTKGLVINDLIRLFLADGTTIDATVASVVDGVSITTITDVSAAVAGDYLYLRPATVAFDLLPTFLWSNTHFMFGATAVDALATGTELRVEAGSLWEIDHNFNNTAGELRSGSEDPASLARTTGNAALTVKKFFDTPEDLEAYNALSKQACIIRHFAYEAGHTYELRIILNSLVTDDPIPQIKPEEINFSNITYHPNYSQADGQGMAVTVINNVSAID